MADTETYRQAPICGVHVDEAGTVWLCHATGDARTETADGHLNAFVWADSGAGCVGASVERLEGAAPLGFLWRFEQVEDYYNLLRLKPKPAALEYVRQLEGHFMLQNRLRMFDGLRFGQLRRCQLDIETACSVPGGFSSPKRKEDRILSIGLRFGAAEQPVFLNLEAMTDAAERQLLKEFAEVLTGRDPDIIEGHNIFNFDFEYLRRRCQRLKLPCTWGRFGQDASFRKSRLRVAERYIDFSRCDIPGRTVFDTYLAVQLYDLTRRELTSYGLKDVAIQLGITGAKDGRTYLPGEQIQESFFRDRETFLAYLADDLRETAGLADLLLPTYVAQTLNFPMTLQEVCLRGTGAKVDLLLLERYYHAKRALPVPSEIKPFEGGYTRSFTEGVFHGVLHFDVASLYPSLLLTMDRNPVNDSLGTFMPLLKELREYRLKYKKLSREAETEALRREYDARQASFKILINSFYGYLGFGGARFADGELAAEVTRRGRELLQALIAEFQALGGTVLEADTDGIYVAAGEYFETPEALLDKVLHVLPQGIELEYDGSYPTMLCYAAKNYALYDGKKVTIRGSALRSRGIEPFLKELTHGLIHHLLGLSDTRPEALEAQLREEIEAGTMEIRRLAKSEYLSMDPEAYRKKIESGGKPRRASLEVALQMQPVPRMGEQVSFYIQPKQTGQTSDWQRARPLDAYDPATRPYDPKYYLKKLDDWRKRYSAFVEKLPESQNQGELFG